ncbi:helix-turn-helix domain containing protein [Asticcacaulis sp. BYS171W]|uniref:Helix-turn-helix domain containing protein n=1 Tax=Asticcacaulis aquaticus TaxID=2984212 RepID=A0ABT5HT63_9CAUL|nr:helix-turn-helix domain-containing protein [Asticcacaulis aquaticus]MDC7683247.1 helix-turn-helix domain containing protein [Asticcacaulis aquaticus]
MTLSPQSKRGQAKARNRALVLDAARKTFEKRGYELTTLRLIGIEAGLSTGVIFGNWPDKRSLYVEIYGHPPLTPEAGKLLWDYLVASGQNPASVIAGEVIVTVDAEAVTRSCGPQLEAA